MTCDKMYTNTKYNNYMCIKQQRQETKDKKDQTTATCECARRNQSKESSHNFLISHRYARGRKTHTHTHTHTQVASCFQRRLLDSVAEFCGFVARLLKSASERALGHGLFLHHHLYSAAFYFATQTFTSVGYGNIAATTVAEQWVATVGMVFGAFFFAFVTGQFAVVITTLVDSYEVRNACVCVCVSVRIPPTPKKSSQTS